jgi:hypothetical protein
MHCLCSVYWVITPLHVSGLSAAHNQQVECIYVCCKWYLLYFWSDCQRGWLEFQTEPLTEIERRSGICVSNLVFRFIKCSWFGRWISCLLHFHKKKVRGGGSNTWPVPVVTRSKAWVYVRSFAGIAGSNPAAGMDVCLLWVLCVVR